MKDPYKIIKHPLATEKAVRLMESDNKLIFVVDKSSTKSDIKKAAQDLFKIKIISIRTMVDTKGRKKAYVKLSPETPAIDVATQMGLV